MTSIAQPRDQFFCRHAVVDDNAKHGDPVDLLDMYTRWWQLDHLSPSIVSLDYNLAGLRCVQAQVVPVSPRLDMSQFFGTRVTVVRRNYQVSVIGILYDDIVATPWPHVGRSDNISGRTEAGPLHDAGGNFCDFRYIILESSTVSES